jgi:nucleotide-binding universal stress UspA family protein
MTVHVSTATEGGQMVTIKHILYPIDFSECSYEVLPYVLSLAEKYGATIYLLYVAHDLSHFAGFHVPHTSIGGFTKELVEASERMMDQVCDDHLDRCPHFQRRVVVGDVGEEIVRMAETEQIDLIVMGTHGRKGLDRTLFGSVAEFVVKHSSAPVLTVNPYRLKERHGKAA